MKKILILIFALSFLSACESNPKKSENNTTEKTKQVVQVEEIELSVNGMTCAGCENTIKNGLKQMEGVVEVEASYQNKKVTVKVEKDKVSREEIAQKIESVGYTVED